MRTPLFMAFGFVLMFAGCVTPPPQDLSASDKVTPLTGMAPLPVRCTPETWKLVEETHALGLSIRYETGTVFASAFAGAKPEEPFVEIVSSQLSAKITDMGFTGLFSYRATICLHFTGTTHDLKAENTRAVHGFESNTTSVKMVVETVVADLASQVKALITPAQGK